MKGGLFLVSGLDGMKVFGKGKSSADSLGYITVSAAAAKRSAVCRWLAFRVHIENPSWTFTACSTFRMSETDSLPSKSIKRNLLTVAD